MWFLYAIYLLFACFCVCIVNTIWRIMRIGEEKEKLSKTLQYMYSTFIVPALLFRWNWNGSHLMNVSNHCLSKIRGLKMYGSLNLSHFCSIMIDPVNIPYKLKLLLSNRFFTIIVEQTIQTWISFSFSRRSTEYM